jgi:hypothetical protein
VSGAPIVHSLSFAALQLWGGCVAESSVCLHPNEVMCINLVVEGWGQALLALLLVIICM